MHRLSLNVCERNKNQPKIVVDGGPWYKPALQRFRGDIGVRHRWIEKTQLNNGLWTLEVSNQFVLR